MYRITKEIQLDSAHRLEGHPKCGIVHGHTYRLEVEIEGERLNDYGLLLDFGTIKELLSVYDHRMLNDFLEYPTAERLAYYFWEEIETYCMMLPHKPTCSAVRVWETPTSCAEYIPGNF